MRILHTIYDDPANPWLGGGGALRTFEICRVLSDRHEITILCGNYPGAATHENWNGCQIVRVGSAGSYAASRLSFSFHASRYLRSVTPDLWVYSFSAFAPLTAGQHERGRSILECFHVMQEHASAKRGLLGHAAARIETHTLSNYPQVISISPSVKDTIAGIRGSHEGLHLVYTGVDDTSFLEDTGEGDYILYFGRLDTYTKGLDLLFPAFRKVADSEPNVRLVVAGRSTPDRLVELKQLADQSSVADRVELIGSVDGETKAELYRGSLFNVAPSRYEGWCIAAVEASAAGKAIVGTDISGLRDAVRDGETGLLVESENIDALAKAMSTLISDASLRKRMGEQGRGWAKQFTWDRVALAQEHVYNAIAAGRGQTGSH